ncbi:hypothetical protein Kpho02_06430 [Kitasatospora phosalacinea]|uniref:Uncharacterized protein n=1 Tax=Kitasatospora phosalacinea TaxID=2065 RepID=A0A9W6UYC3_9ACTN|nr:hypothetical protein Kpho02_06430 [Kitasatospora phosalacinea]
MEGSAGVRFPVNDAAQHRAQVTEQTVRLITVCRSDDDEGGNGVPHTPARGPCARRGPRVRFLPPDFLPPDGPPEPTGPPEGVVGGRG